MKTEAGEFTCPECGSKNAEFELMVGRYLDPLTSNNPWDAVLQIITCADCKRGIPAHLAERWNGMTVEEAQREWREIYRDFPDEP